MTEYMLFLNSEINTKQKPSNGSHSVSPRIISVLLLKLPLYFWWLFLLIYLTTSEINLKPKQLGTPLRHFSYLAFLMWEDPKSQPHLLMAAYMKDMEESLFLPHFYKLIYAFAERFLQWLLEFTSSGLSHMLKTRSSFVGWTITGLDSLEFPSGNSHCWTSWTTICKPL